MYTMSVTSEENGGESKMITLIKPYQTLLEVCLDHQIPLRHDCGGVCHCITCHVYIEKGAQSLSEPSRREIDFLKRCPHRRQSSRLACQSILQDGSGMIEILIPVEKED